MTITTAAEQPADYGDYRPCGALSDHDHAIIVLLPLGAWAQLRAWHRDPNARPLLVRDRWGQTVSVDRRFVAQVERRDLDACVVLEEREREQAAARLVEGE
jgi:hypothetical protein